MNKVWLITGSATGLGRNIAEAVLESGDRPPATRRLAPSGVLRCTRAGTRAIHLTRSALS